MLSSPSPSSFIIFGASGHLAQLKLYPSLFTLWQKNRLPEEFNVVGFSRSEMDDEGFRKVVEESIRENVPEPNEKILKDFLIHCHYHQGQYDDEKDFKNLSAKLDTLEKGWEDTVRVAYYSVPPKLFTSISENICKGGIHTGKIPFRCIVEKPVGDDLKSFDEVKKLLLGCFAEEEIYLLDHYLGKEAVRNVYYLRFANPVLERLLKNTLIDRVEITAMEDAGIMGRAGYFEHTGTFRDMFQSHMLMIMSLLTMRVQEETPIPEARFTALKQIYLPPSSGMEDLVLHGQYLKGTVRGKEVLGYTEEEGVDPKSRTNTFAAMRLMSRETRWEGIPFYLRSGKRLGKKETRISVQFQERRKVGEGSSPNRLHIILQGEAGMRFELQTKLGGTEPSFRPLVLADPLVCMGDCLPEHGLLLLEAIHGNKQWYLSFDEVQTAWRLMDPLQKHLEQESTPLHAYAAGSNGPVEVEDWIKKDSVEWMQL